MAEEHNTPGQLIQELLDARGWTLRVLAIIIGVSETTLSKVVAGRQPLTASMALAIGEVLDVPAERLLQLQHTYDLARARLVAKPDPGRSARAHLFGGLPIADMIRRGWIRAKDVRDVERVEAELARFFGVSSPTEIEIFPHAAKKTQIFGDANPAQLAWLYRVKQIANEMLVSKFTENSAKHAVLKLSNLRASAEASRNVPKILMESGIRFAIVESLPGAKIDGVCLWLNPCSPVIALTLRYDRIDNFWFVLRHELEHVIRGDGRDALMLDAELEGERAGTGDGIPEQERVANAAAAEFCVPQRDMSTFVARKSPFFAERDILGFSKTIGIHPGLVAGQLQHRTGRYDRFRSHQVKIRAHVAPGSIVDGWGDVAPID